MPKDENGNVKIGHILEIDTIDSLLIGNKRVLVLVGLENVMIVETNDVLLIAKKGEGRKSGRL